MVNQKMQNSKGTKIWSGLSEAPHRYHHMQNDVAEATSAGGDASGRRRIEKGNCVEIEAEAGYIFGFVDSDE